MILSFSGFNLVCLSAMNEGRALVIGGAGIFLSWPSSGGGPPGRPPPDPPPALRHMYLVFEWGIYKNRSSEHRLMVVLRVASVDHLPSLATGAAMGRTGLSGHSTAGVQYLLVSYWYMELF